MSVDELSLSADEMICALRLLDKYRLAEAMTNQVLDYEEFSKQRGSGLFFGGDMRFEVKTGRSRQRRSLSGSLGSSKTRSLICGYFQSIIRN